ncbi:MAG: pyridoxal phosphate-dependent aminotransferase [Pyrinomonadaceae bacterium]
MIEHDIFADRALRMKGSSTLKAALAATRLREQGIEVIDLTVGEPDFDTPEFIKDYAIEALRSGITKYTPGAGMTMFRNAVAENYARNFGATFGPENVAASCGGKQGLFNAIATLVNEGDEVLIPKPYWVTYPEIVTFCGGTNVYIETEETGFVLDPQQVADAITDKTKLLILNSPSNPSGRVIPASKMLEIFDICAEKGVYVVTDECYLQFVYPPEEVFTAASLPIDYLNHVCISASFSKTYAMTGWRMGFTIAKESWTKQMIKLQSHSATHPTSFAQYACAKALENDDKTAESIGTMLEEYIRRRDWFINALRGIQGLRVEMPEGAFYAFVDVRDILCEKFPTSADFVDAILNERALVATDGTGFGAEGFVRLSYATSMANLEKAVAELGSFISESKS